MKILITGEKGFIGSNLLPILDGEVVPFGGHGNYVNILDDYGKDFDVCIHLGGNGDPAKSEKFPVMDITNNAIFTMNLCNFFNIKRFIYMSSAAVYDGLEDDVNPESKLDPKLPYAISKLASEQYVKYYHKIGKIKEYVILRFDGAFGPHEPKRKITTKLITRLGIDRAEEAIVRGDGSNYVDYMYIKDVVKGLKKVIECDFGMNTTYDFCSGQPLRFDEFVKVVKEELGSDASVLFDGENLAESIKFICDPARFNEVFHFKPTWGLRAGIKDFYGWLA